VSLLFEPRAFWSVGRIDTAVGSGQRPANALRLPRRDFFNGSRWPITLRQLLVAPIGYALAQYKPNDIPTNSQNFRNSGIAALGSAQVRISSPQSTHYTHADFNSHLFDPEARWEPAPGDVVGLPGSIVGASDLWGAYKWQFDHPMDMPARGGLELWLGAVRQPFFANPVSPVASIGLEEVGGLVPGNQRNVVRRPLRIASPGTVYPWGLDGFPPNGGVTTNLWHPDQSLQAREWKAQRVTAEGGSPVHGFTVHIDQLDWDTEILAAVPGPPGTTAAVSPLGFNTPVRARTVDGGSKAWWWREGAPLALVSPSLTPAHVYTLPQPITLAPGDKLDVELLVPDATAFDQIIQLGVSLCGEATIEQ